MHKLYKINNKYFDKIDNPNKAYWLGFIWADGYVGKRERGNKGNIIEYALKLAIKDTDDNHIKKFANDIETNQPIKYYKTKGFCESSESRLLITNKYMCSHLYEDLGIISFRTDANKVISFIPKKLHKYFILGVFDGDGSFSSYSCKDNGHMRDKMNLSFGGSESLLRFIENHLIENKIIKPYEEGRKLQQRHKDADGTWRTLVLPGPAQAMRILNYLYDSPIYLDRKYEKYLALK